MLKETYNRIFLNENIPKAVLIQFVGTDEVIGNDRIVDQGSFKYTESTNGNEEITLGFSDSSSFEIDIKGDLSEKAGEEISVEVVAYEEKDEDLIAYPLPIGHFIISNVDYDYNNDVSHILSYDKIATDKAGEDITTSVFTYSNVGYVFSNLFINDFFDNIAEDYIQVIEPRTFKKALLPNEYTSTEIWYKLTNEPATYKVKRVFKFQVCEYEFDSELYAKGFTYWKMLTYTGDIVRLDDEDEGISLMRTSVDSDIDSALTRIVGINANYDEEKADDWKYTSDRGSNVPFRRYAEFYPNETGTGFNVVSQFKISIYRNFYGAIYYTKYDDRTHGDFSFPSSVSPYKTSSVGKVSVDDFPSFTMSYYKFVSYKNFNNSRMQLTAYRQRVNALGTITSGRLNSDFAEVQGHMVRMNRKTGDFQAYGFVNDSAIYPSNDIYPSSDLYPSGSSDVVKITKDMYSNLVAKTKRTKKVGKVIATDRNGNQVSATVSDFNENDYSTITISEKNFFIQVGFISAQTVCDSILAMYKDYSFTPFDLDCVGIPYLESGDWIVVETDDGQQRLNVSRRTLSGIQGMMDSLSAGGI